MGNYRFRFSHMMPNAWFYKLKDMGKPSKSHNTKKKQPPTTAAAAMVGPSKTSKPKEQNQPPNPNPSRPRQSYYFTRDLNLVPNDDVFTAGRTYNPAANLPDPPRKSSKQRTRKRNSRPSPKRVTFSAVSADCTCSAWNRSDSLPEYSSSPLDSSPEQNSGDENGIPPAASFDGMVSTWCSCKVDSNSKPSSIVIEVDDKSFKTQLDKLQEDFDSISDRHHLPPIITRPAGFNAMINDIRRRDQDSHSDSKSLSVKLVQEQRISIKEQKPNTPARRNPLNSPGVRLRIHSPKIASKKIQAAGRRSVSSTSSSSSRRSISDSCAVVKSSFDPQRDFKESMMEMITENNLRASKDLEDLLACYLSLNSDEYHELIIKVFKQIWFDLSDLKFK